MIIMMTIVVDWMRGWRRWRESRVISMHGHDRGTNIIRRSARNRI
ncbi:hypothetical protein MtrunA17_Chr7g0269091 [Medicago truncatula]|uniref:Uncharacterized protein n=1 Tax=Medicago truncatula TaxID=3880 RepID=A0A396H858_MEDTR|nr:hypothetical protein MtrunA17_Chr7g0269091 [Medicago truncatula]